jgi:anti-anti-sigma factor
MSKSLRNRSRAPDRVNRAAGKPPICGEPETETPSGSAEPQRTSTIQAARAGEWIDAAELRQWAMEHLESRVDTPGQVPASGMGEQCKPVPAPETNLVLDLRDIDYLEASALQIVLAIAAEQRRRGRYLQLVNTSEQLGRWFEFAGAASLLQRDVVVEAS